MRNNFRVYDSKGKAIKALNRDIEKAYKSLYKEPIPNGMSYEFANILVFQNGNKYHLSLLYPTLSNEEIENI